MKLNFLDVRVHEDRYIIPVARHSGEPFLDSLSYSTD